MLEQKIDSQLSEFDIKHFCDGNPVYCYYYRLPNPLSKKVLACTNEDLKQPSEVDIEKLRNPSSPYTAPQESFSTKQQHQTWWK